jgi:SP family arabinose:H+ symporter-like MFS transporter
MNANLTKAAVVGALGGLLFGFDTAVISGTTHSLTIAYCTRLLGDWKRPEG